MLGGTDPRVRRAAAVARLLIGAPRTTDPTAVRSRGDGGTPGSADVGRQLHLEVLHATRAAVRDTRGVDRRLLETVERDLLMPRPAVVSFRAALMEWEDCVAEASVQMDARSALTVARTQSALLSAGLSLMQRFEVTDGVGHERLQDAAQVASRSWGEAARIWRGLCPRGPAPMGRLERAMVHLQLAVSSSGDKERLDSLLHTGFGGVVVAAMAVTPRGMHSGSDLVTSAVTLSVRSELAGGLLESRGSSGTEIDSAATRTPDPSRAMAIAGRTQTTPTVGQLIESGQPPQFGDAAQLAGLARTRDAGVVAGVARQGNAEATRLFADASDSELARLEHAGVVARARIAESALPLVYAKSREVASRHREEFVSLASLRLVEAAARWDPHRATWSTYAGESHSVVSIPVRPSTALLT